MVKKDELLEHINIIQKEISTVFDKVDHYETFKILLCLLDSFMDAQLKLQQTILTSQNVDEKNIVFYNHNFLHIRIIYTLIDYILSHAAVLKSTGAETPDIIVFVMESIFPEFPNSEEYLAQLCDLNKAEAFHWEFGIHNDPIYYRRYFLIRNGQNLSGIKNVESTIRLIQMFWKLMVARTALTKSSHFTIESDGKIKFYDISDKLIQDSRIDQRSISVERDLFPSWDSEVIQSQTRTLNNLDNLRQNRQDVLDEFAKIKSAFESLSNFKDLFADYYKMSLDDYYAIKTGLCMLVYDTTSRIIRLPKAQLIKQIKHYSGKPQKLIEKVLDDFIWKRGDTIFEKFLIYDGNYFTYNWDTALYSTELPLHTCYQKIFNNDKKGQRYEEECRKIFKNNSLFVCDGRLLISQQIVPNSFFAEYNARIKKETDLDVIGTKSNILFIIECKAKKAPLDLSPVYKELERHYRELLWKVQWISEHKEDFMTLAKNQSYNIPDFDYVVPLLVTNIVSPNNSTYNSANFTELKHILNNFQINNDSKYVTTLPTGVEISMPVFKIVEHIEQI